MSPIIRTLALISSVSILLAGSSGPCRARPPKDGLVPFASEAGGYEIRIPPSWLPSETSESSRYEATAKTRLDSLLTMAGAPAEKSTEAMRDSLVIKRKWNAGDN